MTDLVERVRQLALTAERAAADRQHADLTAAGGPGPGPAVIGSLEVVAHFLWAATGALGLHPALIRRPQTRLAVTMSLLVGLSIATLLLVPDPTRPWVLAVVVPGCAWASESLWRAGRAIRDRRVPPAGARPLAEVLTELRDGMAAVVADLEPEEWEEHRAVADSLEGARIWLDEAGIQAGKLPR